MTDLQELFFAMNRGLANASDQELDKQAASSSDGSLVRTLVDFERDRRRRKAAARALSPSVRDRNRVGGAR